MRTEYTWSNIINHLTTSLEEVPIIWLRRYSNLVGIGEIGVPPPTRG